MWWPELSPWCWMHWKISRDLSMSVPCRILREWISMHTFGWQRWVHSCLLAVRNGFPNNKLIVVLLLLCVSKYLWLRIEGGIKYLLFCYSWVYSRCWQGWCHLLIRTQDSTTKQHRKACLGIPLFIIIISLVDHKICIYGFTLDYGLLKWSHVFNFIVKYVDLRKNLQKLC